jgi:putative flavoprotein involved in K+ transport
MPAPDLEIYVRPGTRPEEERMNGSGATERFDTVVIGGGQAGLAMGYHLEQRGQRFVILEAGERIGDSWRKRWDSLRLFTPARHDGLPGWSFPAPPWSFPTRDAMADYLEAYAARFELPVRTGVRVDGLRRDGDRLVVTAGERAFEAENVVVASGPYERAKVPAFAGQLDPGITQLHSSRYTGPSQLREGGVLVVGAGNSGAEIAMESAASGHPTWLSGRPVGEIPFRIEGTASRLLMERLILRFVFHRVLTVKTPVGRKARSQRAGQGTPLIRTKTADLAAAGIERLQRVIGAREGQPVLEDGRALQVANVVWCTGFEHDYSWIDLPGMGEHGPEHQRGVVEGEPGLYFVGLHFLYSVSSAMIHGVGRDADYIARQIAARTARDRSGQRVLAGA